ARLRSQPEGDDRMSTRDRTRRLDGADDGEASNEEYLAAALDWLRLRLASHAAARQVEIIMPTEPRPEPEPSPRAQAQRWRWRQQQEPARPPAGAVPFAALPAPPSAPDLDARLAAADAAMRAAASRSPAPAPVRLGQLLGLAPFELHTLLLCAAMEL